MTWCVPRVQLESSGGSTLEGLPIVVKANIEGPPGSLVSASTPAMKDFRPATTAPCVEKLLAVRRPSSYS
jgi:Asp-tRNA(Asn)/Glu-tRNA(Gln) amidotransferase A subunit family amidase